jgi:hypothetical protein
MWSCVWSCVCVVVRSVRVVERAFCRVCGTCGRACIVHAVVLVVREVVRVVVHAVVLVVRAVVWSCVSCIVGGWSCVCSCVCRVVVRIVRVVRSCVWCA